MNRRLYHLHLLTSGLRIFGDAIETVALPWSLLEGTGSLVSIGGYALFTHLPWIFLPPLLGKSLDRTPKKVRLAFLALILQSLLAVLVVPLFSNLWAFYIVVSGISALDILHRYYGFSLIASMTLEENELQGLNANLSLLGNLVSLVAFPIAGALAYRFGVKAMLVDAVLLIMGGLSLLPYLGVEIASTEEERNSAEKAPKLNGRFILGVLASLLLFNFALGSFRIFVFARLKGFRTAEFLYGIMETLTTLGSLIGVGLIFYRAHRKEAVAVRTLLLGMVFQSVALLLIGVPGVYSLISAVFIVGFGGELLNVSSDSLFQKYIPLENLGTARGLFDALATLAIPVSQLVFAWMIERSGEIQSLAVLAFFMAVASSLFLSKAIKKAKA